MAARSRYYESISCKCQTCTNFRWGRGHDCVTKCELCGDSGYYRNIAPHVPQLLRDFFNVTHICAICARTIESYVGVGAWYDEGWGLCWENSPDEALKWAMVDWLRSAHFGQYEFRRIEIFHRNGDYSPMKSYADRCEWRKAEPS